MELTEELDDFILRRPVIPQLSIGRFPHLVNGSLPVHETDDHMRRRTEPVKPVGGQIMQDIPDLAAILLTLQANVSPQSRLEPFDSIPGGAEKIVRHRPLREPTRV